MPLVLRVSETGTTTISIEATDDTARLLLGLVVGVLKQSGPIVIEAAPGEPAHGSPKRKLDRDRATLDLGEIGSIDLGPLSAWRSGTSDLGPLAVTNRTAFGGETVTAVEEAAPRKTRRRPAGAAGQ
jgi:hypothetical protein